MKTTHKQWQAPSFLCMVDPIKDAVKKIKQKEGKQNSLGLKLRQKLRWRLEWLLFMILLSWVRLWPLKQAHRSGKMLCLGLHWLGFRRRITEQTIATAFGTALSPKKIRSLSKQCYAHFGSYLAELLVFDRIPVDKIAEHVEIDNPEVLLATYRQGRGIILLAGHLGGWEFVFLVMKLLKVPFIAYAGFQHNYLVDKAINKIRRGWAPNTIGKQDGVRALVQELRKGSAILMVGDQHFSKKKLFVRFFGQFVSAAPGLERLQKATGAAPVYVSCIREGALRYRVRFQNLASVDQPLMKKQVAGDLTQRYFQALETSILETPEQYFWMHGRWRELSLHQIPKDNREVLAQGEVPGDRPLQSLPITLTPPTSKDRHAKHSCYSKPPTTLSAGRALFLDRDGVLLAEHGYLKQLSELRLLPQVAEALKLACQKGWRPFVITNQSGVARGLFDEAFVLKCHQKMEKLLAKEGAKVEAIYHSPWHVDGQSPWDRLHPDRKPSGGMLLRACKVHSMSLTGAVMIGDQLSDLETGASLGVRPFLVRTGQGKLTQANWDSVFATKFRRRGGRIFADLLTAVTEGL